jgi:hypothetical protein
MIDFISFHFLSIDLYAILIKHSSAPLFFVIIIIIMYC